MRHRITQQLDSAPSFIGDNGWIGVNSRLDPSAVPAGYATEAKNMRFRNGVAETRKGFIIPPWLNNIVAGKVLPWGNVYGVGLFSDPVTLVDYTIIAADGNVYFTTENQAATALTLPVGETVTTNVNFAQAFDTLVMFRGAETEPLSMAEIASGFSTISETPSTITRSGTTATVTTPLPHLFSSGDLVLISGCDQSEYNGEQTIVVTSPTTFTYTVSGSPVETATGDIRVNSDGTEPIPNADRGLFFQNRLLIPNDLDEIAVSDFGSYTKYLPVVQELKINVGSSDTLVALTKFNDTTVIAFKEHSIYALTGFAGSLTGLQQDQITSEFGLVAADSVAQCGADLLFLSQMGVMSLRQTEQNKVQGVNSPLSEPIQPLIDRINWRYAANAKAAYWDNKYYLAVPLDGAESMGPELVPPDALGIFTTVTIDVTAGDTYKFVLGNATNLQNGAEAITTSRNFIAEGSTVVITKPSSLPFPGTPSTSSIRRLIVGVNNTILVYDFLNRAWAGYDQAENLTVKQFHIRKYRDIDRLFVVTEDGFILLYEEDYTDQLTVPYTDVIVTDYPTPGQTITVNGGDTITTITGGNTPTGWGRGVSATDAAINLFSGSQRGYYLHNTQTVWSAPNTLPLQVENGVRFLSTNGALPLVVTDVTAVSVEENARQEIEATLTTRGYTPDAGADLAYFDWLSFDAQTWNPNYSVTLIMDGVKEESVVASSITKNRARYTTFGRADYDTTNSQSDSELPYREDYSVLFGNAEDAQAFLVDYPTEVELSHHQQAREEFKIRKRGRSARVKFVSSQGRLRLLSCKLQSRSAQTKAGSQVL